MAEQQIRNPVCMTRMLAPGFPDPVVGPASGRLPRQWTVSRRFSPVGPASTGFPSASLLQENSMKAIVVLVGGLVLTSALAPSAHADDAKTYYNKAAFLADTAATSATGPLPDVGIILDADVDPPVSSYTLGLSHLRPDPGQRQRVHGRGGNPRLPDWYPQTPGHDMAFGWERFQVSTSGLVYSFGFDIVEPDATMPDFGGTPEESTYEFLLFNGTLHVGTVLFDGKTIPNDVETFIGVWSDQAVRPRRHQRPQRQR